MCLWEALEGLQQNVNRWGWWQRLPAGSSGVPGPVL